MISVLIPTYNYNVTELLKTVKQQCDKLKISYEIIVCDDASTKPVLDDNINFTQFKYSKNSKNLGRTRTRFKLAKMAQYNNLLFLDADVIPVNENFVHNYLTYLNKNEVVFGGYAYKTTPNQYGLRFKFGKYREEIDAAIRNESPYSLVFSGNFLIDKNIFLTNNYPGSGSFYGMDLYFGYSLYKNKVNVVHINNPIYHLGLEPDDIFLRKSLEAVKTRKQLLTDYKEIAITNTMARHYLKLKRSGFYKLVEVGFKLSEPLLRKLILKKNPSLLIFDLYRLGYMCTL